MNYCKYKFKLRKMTNELYQIFFLKCPELVKRIEYSSESLSF